MYSREQFCRLVRGPVARALACLGIRGGPKIISLAHSLILLWRTPSDSLTKRLDAASLAKYVKKNIQLG